jgi:flagellar biosynthesis/type III secretory pathway protein FliH
VGSGFASLAGQLATDRTAAVVPRDAVAPAATSATPAIAEIPPPVHAAVERALNEFSCELRLALARSQEWAERTARSCAVLVAQEVFARESALAPTDVEALVVRALETFVEARPVALRIAECDRERVAANVPFTVDHTLAGGDLVLETPDGEIDLRIVTRLRAIVENIHA